MSCSNEFYGRCKIEGPCWTTNFFAGFYNAASFIKVELERLKLSSVLASIAVNKPWK